jgi:hypothetical protein
MKLCPKCLNPVRSMNGGLTGFVPMEYYCPKCGYSGAVYVTKEAEPNSGND